MTQQDKLVLIGMTALVIGERLQLDRTEAAIQKFLEGCGVSERDARNWSGELVYNEGDDPIAAVNNVLNVLEITF